MSELDQTGASSAAPSEPAPASAQPVPAPAAVIPAVEQQAPAASTVQSGAFGTTRGAGLARGKRPTSVQATAPKASEYKPTAIEIVKTSTAFANPFAPVEPEPAPEAAPAPVAEVKPEVAPVAPAAPVVVSEAPAAEVPTEKPAPEAASPSAPAREIFTPKAVSPEAVSTADSDEKGSLNILPPAETKRPAQSWESRPQRPEREGRWDDRPRRDDRERGFRPERRDERGGFRPERREQQPQLEQRAPLPQKVETPVKKGGFINWLKGLFGAKAETKPEVGQDRPRREGDQGHRHHHHGGRGRDGERFGGGFQQNRGENRGEGRPYQGGDQGGGDQGGQRRRRRRGGRGRHFGDRGDFRGPDSSGPQQG